MTSTDPAPALAGEHIPLVDLAAQYRVIGAEIDAAIQRVVGRNDFIMGAAVGEFESAFGAYCGVPHAIAVSSGTDALFLALRALGLAQGDEVIVPSMTFTATAEPVVNAGGRPIFVDVKHDDLQIDPASVARAITPRTRGIIPVHLYGMASDLDALTAIAKEHGLWILEDAAQAHGATWHGKRVGNFGVAACFSFYPGKNLGAFGDAGMIVTSDPGLAGHMRMLRDHGRTTKYEHEIVGYGARMDTLQAAILNAKLAHLDEWTAARQAAAELYDELLGNGLERVGANRRDGAVHHLYVVRVPAARRDSILKRLQADQIGAGIHYPIPLHQQPAYEHLGLGGQSLPEAELAGQEIISLPLYPEITPAQQKRVVASLMHALAEV